MSIRHRNNSETLAALAHRASNGTQFLFDEFVDELRDVTTRPVVFIIDEHHEIYKVQKERTAFFRSFTIATGYLHGVWFPSSSDPSLC